MGLLASFAPVVGRLAMLAPLVADVALGPGLASTGYTVGVGSSSRRIGAIAEFEIRDL